MNPKVLLLTLLVVLVGCTKPATWVGLAPGEVVVHERLAVRIDGAWSRLDGLQEPKHDVWTSDGTPLDQLHFHTGIAEGESLVVVKDRPADKPIPRFRKDMQAQDVVELYESFASRDGSVFKLEKLAPARFADEDGFRFEFSRVRKSDEVRMRGVGYGAIHHGELFLMVFEAPRIHYFAKHLPRVEAIAQSAHLREKA
ncbi:hypothetical protein [Geothrix campi]|jgi:hypothetical protein|uniref:hypothetical protein n=1 Tax=Geothrix campi TaxID=2966450 RepID=UPI0021491AA9|nr:hypothetical protein [Geothrix sp. SG10]